MAEKTPFLILKEAFERDAIDIYGSSRAKTEFPEPIARLPSYNSLIC